MDENRIMIPVERIKQSILLIRGQKVMLDRDLACLYRVETRVLNQAVQRNIKRFPEDLMFVLNRDEIMRISQIVTSSDIKYAKRFHAFIEQGVAMLSSVLRSERAIEVNIPIIRSFVQLRGMLASNVELARKLKQMEKKYDEQFKVVFDAIRALMEPPEKPRKKIGFEIKEKGATYGRCSPKRKRKTS
ncbi:MAG: ORF6N domain-containing protein [Thermodesulfobacteriota bacterium]|nr:ORF6N domain-containing protein [Thermodesulfobacteriota bacterium]